MSNDRAPLLMLLLGVLLVVGFFFWIRSSPQPVQAPKSIALEVDFPPALVEPVEDDLTNVPLSDETAEALPVLEQKSEYQIVQPPSAIDGSDIYIKKALTDVMPGIEQWTISSQLLRKWVLFVDLMADGYLVRQDKPLSYPMRRFEVKEIDKDRFIAIQSENYPRSNQLLDVVLAVDVELLAYYYRAWLPLCEKAYRELGKKGSFHGRVKKVIKRLVEVRPLDEPPVLVKQGGVMFRYENPVYENASDVEKLMWRLGPGNASRLQGFLVRFNAAISG